MFNCNGLIVSQLIDADPDLIFNLHKNFSFIENVRFSNGKILFWEKHYFRIIASLRRYRCKIPISFTMEKLEGELLKLFNIIDSKTENALFRFQFIKNLEQTSFVISLSDTNPIKIGIENYQVDLYKDILMYSHNLSNMSKTNSDLRLIASMYAIENGLDDIILINDQKKITETLNGSIFLLESNQIQTPSLYSGCQDFVLRQVFLEWIKKNVREYNVLEKEINPFELQKSEEIFIVSLEKGLQFITNYRKSKYSTDKGLILLEKFTSCMN
tara:strand:- start:402 stop:1214 length:813 start_codon:yes stop_codon:yes gene_type:complete